MLTDHYRAHWAAHAGARWADFTSGRSGWVQGLAPELAVSLPPTEVSRVLYKRLGEDTFRACLDPARPYPSPVADEPTGDWLRSCHTVGVNVRTVGDFWRVVHYALTLPPHLRGVHLLPVWEPGVVGSLYGMASWELNPEFFSADMARMFPGLATPADQLAVVVNFLHALGKVVGLDVIPHTDRYSEIVLANPAHFEWLRRADLAIVSHRADLHEEAAGAILQWLRERGPARPAYGMVGEFHRLPEADRLRLLFGEAGDYDGRRARRIDLVDWLYHRGLEPVPATMAPPYRGLAVDPDPAARTVDAAGRVWRDYRITRPTTMSRVFGPLTRYKLYGRRDDNRSWEIDFATPRPAVWDYLTGHYAAQVRRYGFDFMRGDMSHVQMRPTGVPEVADAYYDPLRAVKRRVQRGRPYFAYFAESFLTPPGYMAYGDEVAHLERSEAEVTLGNLQSYVPGSPEFMALAERYLDVARERAVTPAWTVLTADKDDPRFDHFQHHGELARVFTGLFVGLMPLYASLGYEQRDRHLTRAANEAYTKLYVFREERPDKAVSGPYRWGGNLALFGQLTDLHRFAAGVLAHLGPTQQLAFAPDARTALGGELGADAGAGEEARKPAALAWLRAAADGAGAYLFVVSFAAAAQPQLRVVLPAAFTRADLLFATDGAEHTLLAVDDGTVSVADLAGGRCYLLA